MKKAIILLGCPESPSQTPMAIYVTNKLKKKGYEVTISSTPSAMKLLEVSDPESFYIEKKIDVESCLESIEEGSFDLLVGFVHRDAAVSYFVTFENILNTKSLAIISEREMEVVNEYVNMIKESTNAEIVSARAYHNPTPLRVKFDKALNKMEK
ncbi:MAG: DUF1890 domain-containing protein [Methanobacteriaceae archaeon]|jgi:hypothetical protein|nr:MAG: hypothetical protein CIT01_01510 [Methanobacterium sp. BRmetb2]MCC7557269.1 DUF1890 domain-containing protein [Methanobacteriaceae archaeon]